jgi:hypothetical protein
LRISHTTRAEAPNLQDQNELRGHCSPDTTVIVWVKQVIKLVTYSVLVRIIISAAVVLHALKLDSEWKPLFSTMDWEHPEITDQLPSENLFFKSLDNALRQQDVSLIRTDKGNTHWRNWTNVDFDKQI